MQDHTDTNPEQELGGSGFDALTPLFHRDLDDWGLARGTRVWMASGSYKRVQDLEPGDMVLGLGFREEEEWIDRGLHLPHQYNIELVQKHTLVQRRVLAVEEVEARSWEMTFGTFEKQTEDRRLVAGGLTRVGLFPYVWNDPQSAPLVGIKTVLPNERVGQGERLGLEVDRTEFARTGIPTLRQGRGEGEPCGQLITCVPGDIFGGLHNLFDTSGKERDYERFTVKPVRAVDVLDARERLYRVWCTPCVEPQDPNDPDGPKRILRSNLIAQTPFPAEVHDRVVRDADPLAEARVKAESNEDLMKHWESFGRAQARAYEEDRTLQAEGTLHDYQTVSQGQFHLSKRGEFGERFRRRSGLNEWLNGGILIALPVRREDRAHYGDTVAKKRAPAPVARAA